MESHHNHSDSLQHDGIVGM